MIFLFPLILSGIRSGVWVEKNHEDFVDGKEWFYLNVDTCCFWFPESLRTLELGTFLYSPQSGEIRIIGKDWDFDDNKWINALLTLNYTYSVALYYNYESGFDLSNSEYLVCPRSMGKRVSLCDINADEYLGVLVVSYTVHTLHDACIYRRNALGFNNTPDDSLPYIPWAVQNLHPTPEVIHTALYLGFPNVSVADLNNNSELDIMASPSEEGLVVLWGPDFSTSIIVAQDNLSNHGDTVTVWRVSSRDTLIRDDAVITTYIIRSTMLFDLEEDKRGIVGPGGGKIYDLRVLEEGIYNDTVELKIAGGITGWEISLLDSSSNLLEDIDNDSWVELPLNEGVWTPFLLKVVSDGVGDSLLLTIKGRSSRFPELGDSVKIVTVVISRLHVHNYKNPFEDETRFFVRVPQKGYLWLNIYTRSGEKIKEILKRELLEAGEYQFIWGGKNGKGVEVSPGVYIYILEFEGYLGGKEKIIKKAVKVK